MRTPRAARVGWRRLSRSERTLPVVGQPLGQGTQFVAAVEATEAVQPLGGGHPLRRARLDGVGMPEDGLGEEIAFDHVVVEVVQTGPVSGERSEAGCRVELRAQVREVRHSQVGGGLRLNRTDLDGEVEERPEDDGQNLCVLRPQFRLGAPDAGPFQS
jgi:hypothetical protein